MHIILFHFILFCLIYWNLAVNYKLKKCKNRIKILVENQLSYQKWSSIIDRQTDRQTDNKNETNYNKTESNVNNELYLILFSYN